MGNKILLFGIIIFTGLLAIGSVIIQLLIPIKTPTEEILFSSIQFILSIIFGWVLTRVVTNEEFEKNLRKYAFSAYRRVTDINKSIFRILSVLSDEENKPETKLQVIKNISFDIQDTVSSSIADWAEIIGNDLKNLEKIKTLEARIKELSIQKDRDSEFGSQNQLQDETKQLITSIKNQIEEIKTNIPLPLETIYNEPVPPAMFSPAQDLISIYNSMLLRYGNIKLRVTVPTNIPYDDFIELRNTPPGTIFYIYLAQSMNLYQLMLINTSDFEEKTKVIGEDIVGIIDYKFNRIEQDKALFEALIDNYADTSGNQVNIPVAFENFSTENYNEFFVVYSPPKR